MNKLLTACVMSLAIGGELAAYAATTLPQLPQKQVDVTMPTVTGSTLNATCATLQAQLNAAAALNVNLTHQVILATGTICTGPYILPSHTGGTGWILIKGLNFASLPAPGTRVALSDNALMPKIQYGENGNYTGTFAAATGAQRYRVMGLELLSNNSFAISWALVVLGRNNQAATNTGYLIFDRCVVRDVNPADNNHDTIRAFYGDADLGNTALIESYVAGIKGNGRDTQTWLSINNPGPILLRNNFLESAGENVMMGGGEPASVAMMPHDVTITRNTFAKNSLWWNTTPPLSKTLLELKLGIRVLIEGNDFTNMPGNDGGQIFRFTPRNENGGFPNAEVSDITVRYNRMFTVCNGPSTFGSDDGQGANVGRSMHSKRWAFTHNLWYGLGSNCGGTGGVPRLFQIALGGGGSSGTGTDCTDPTPTCKIEDLTFVHNTVDDLGNAIVCVMGGGERNLDWRDNLINANGSRGVFDCNGGFSSHYGTTILNEAWGATWTWTNNSIAAIGGGESGGDYPQGTNSYPASYTSFLWTNRATRDYTLQAGSPAKNTASDGTDRGVNFALYNAARAGGSGGDTTPPGIPQHLIITTP